MRCGRKQIVVATVAAAVLSACGSGDGSGTPIATDRCAAVDFPQVQFGSHLIGDNAPPVPYSSTPPTSGWHTSGAAPEGVFTEPLSEPQQVSVLEAGGVVVTHRGLPSAEVDAIHDLVRSTYPHRVVVTPYDDIDDGGMAFTSWGARQVCDGLDLDALRAYADAYASELAPHD